jgi:WD40 repeat protein
VSPSIPAKAGSTLPSLDLPDWSVEYNPDTKQGLRLDLVNTFTFTHTVYCIKFNCDGKSLAAGLANGEIHVYDMTTGAKRSVFSLWPVISTDFSFIIRVLTRRSATVFYTDAIEPTSGIWTIQFSQDSKHIATGGLKGQINVVEISFASQNVFISLKHFRYGKLAAEDCVPASNMEDLSIVSISPLMASPLLLPHRNHFVYGTYVTAREEHCGMDPRPSCQLHLVQMGDILWLEIGMAL